MVFHKFYKFSNFSIFVFFLFIYLLFITILIYNTYKPYIILPVYNYIFDFFLNFFPNCSFFYRKFFFFDKFFGLDILDGREYYFPVINTATGIPYLKMARYFDCYFGNIFVPSVPSYEKNVREPGYTFIYDIEDFLHYLKNTDTDKLHLFTLLYNNKKLDYFNLFCQDLYKYLHYYNKFNLLDEYHKKMQEDLSKEQMKKPNKTIEDIKTIYVSFLRYFYYPIVHDIFFQFYDSTFGRLITPLYWYYRELNNRAIKYIHSFGHFHRNRHAGKTFTDIAEESGYRNILSRPMRPKPVVTWREFVWVEPEYNKIKASVYKGKKLEKYKINTKDIDLKYDFEQNPILKKKLFNDHHIVGNSIIFLF